jgi:fructosamine-3-kinase
VEAVLDARVTATTPLGGGCISPAFRVTVADGRCCFVKTAPAGAGGDFFAREAEGLERLGAARAVRVPAVLGRGREWLALEWLEPGVADAGVWERLGRGLARLHGTGAAGYGLATDNYIGVLPQANGWMESWAGFWAERRLRPQLRCAAGMLGSETRRAFGELLDDLPRRLDPVSAEGPSLLHGDLWSGNVHMTAEGAALIDPSSYFGHREVDLAMAALFGGFPVAFQEAYTAEWPLAPGATARRAIYQLYYLLVHVNLFGQAYVAATERTLRTALG